MASLNLSHIYKVYPNGAKAVSDFNLEIKDGEFIIFVGPSGCGKSTTLRMIAGLEEITSGELFIDDVLSNDLEPKDRDIAFVFQNYALYPHMTIYENLAFGLKNQKIDDVKRDRDGNIIYQDDGKTPIFIKRHYTKEEINDKIKAASSMLGLDEYLSRKPKEMSGGQRQRVALGRALVRDPKVFLLDEPLSNLDAKLRASMRTEITKLHQRVNKTFIYVTHDQTEAMTMGDRIVVMKDGYIQQIDTPMNLYQHPINKFVAEFIGTPQINIYNGKLYKEDGLAKVVLSDDLSFDIDYDRVENIDPIYFIDHKDLYLGIRPEHIRIEDKGLPFKINVIERLGDDTLLYGNIIGEKTSLPCTIKVDGKLIFKKGDVISIAFDSYQLMFFSKDDERNISDDLSISYKIKGTYSNGILNILSHDIKLPKALTERLKDGQEYIISLPSDCLIDGSDIEVKRDRDVLELIDNGYKYLFKDSIKDEVATIDTTKIDIYTDSKEIIAEHIKDSISLDGKILKEGKGNQIRYLFDIEGYRCDALISHVKKAALIDGYNCHKKTYSFLLPSDSLTISTDGFIQGKVKGVKEYFTKSFADILINEKIVTIPCDGNVNIEDDIKLSLDLTRLQIFRKEDGVRIS